MSCFHRGVLVSLTVLVCVYVPETGGAATTMDRQERARASAIEAIGLSTVSPSRTHGTHTLILSVLLPPIVLLHQNPFAKIAHNEVPLV